MNWPPSLGAVMGARPFPDDLTTKVLWVENLVAYHLEVVAGGRVTMEIHRAGGLEDAMQVEESWRHHYEVGHNVVLTQHDPKRVESLGDLPGNFGTGHQDLELVLSFGCPMPSVVKSFDLSL